MSQFREHFRVKREVADNLIDELQRSEFYKKKEGGGGRKEIPAKIQIYFFLWCSFHSICITNYLYFVLRFAGNKDSYREVANIFNISTSSAYRILSNILEFIFKISPNYIKFPQNDEEKMQISRKFEQVSDIYFKVTILPTKNVAFFACR